MGGSSLMDHKPLMLFVALTAASAVVGLQPRVPVTVYYESLCPDSQAFYVEQLAPNYPALANYMDLLLVPFGKSSADRSKGSPVWTCHHGPNECYGNKVQACILDPLASKMLTQETIDRIKCLMEKKPIKECVPKESISIETCANGTNGDRQLEENERLTENLRHPLTSVPTITFNNTYNATENTMALKGFKAVLCSYINGTKPEVCSGAAPTTAGAMLILVTAAFSFLLAK